MHIKKGWCLCIVFLLAWLCPLPAQQQVKHTIYFGDNSHAIDAAPGALLKKWIDSLSHALSITSITITGHTDNRGEQAYNLLLSQRRAAALKDFLLRAGLDPGKIELFFEGENKPVASNDTEQGRWSNRRAEVAINLAFTEKPREQPAEPGPGDPGLLYRLLKDPPQVYCIDVTKDTFLVGKRGTIIHYKANMIRQSHLSCRCFTIHLNEYFDNADLVLNNLTTTSDGQPLESGGMIRLAGYCDEKKYELKDGEYLTVMVPADTILPGMKLLSANRENEADYLNWVLDTANGGELDTFDL